MKILFGEVWLSFGDLIDIGIKEVTIKMGASRKSPSWKTIKDPEDKRKILICYSTLAPKYKKEIINEMCGGFEPILWLESQKEIKLNAEQQEFKDSLQDRLKSACDRDYIKKAFHYPGIDNPQLKCLCRAAAVLEETVKWYNQKGISFKDHAPVKIVAKWLKENMEEYFPIKYIPTYHLNLMEKVKAYAIESKPLNEIIYLPRTGNDNRSSHKIEKWWKEVAIYHRVKGKNLTQAQIYRKIDEMAVRVKNECPSESTVRQFLYKNEHLTVQHHSDLNNKRFQRHRSSVPLSRAMYSDDCWEMDGTQVQFIGHLTGNKGKSGKSETKSLYVIAVRDVYSGAYLGYWYGYSESEHAYRSALKMAVEITGRLPYELRYDQFPGSTSAGWKYLAGEKGIPGALEKHGVKITKTSKSSGKANAERGFYTLQQVFEAEKEQYIGHGIKSSLAHARPTEQYIARTLKTFLNNGWDFDKAWQAHSAVIAAYNQTPMCKYSRKYADLTQSPWDLYQGGIDEAGRAVSPIEISELFWNARSEGIRNNRIEFTDRGKKYRYYIGADEMELLEYQRKNVVLTIRHDPFDFSKIMVFDGKNGAFLAELTEQADIQTYGKNADWESVAKFKEKDKALNDRKKKALSEYDLSEETAVLLPMNTEKIVYNDALTRHAHQNAGEWMPKKKVSKPAKNLINTGFDDDFDVDEYVRSQM